MANKDCQKCGKTIDTEKETIFYLDSNTNTVSQKSKKRICADCWEVGKDGEWIDCCDVLEELPLSQSDVKGPDGNLLKVRKIVRIEGIYDPPKPKANETDSPNDTKQEKQMVQPTEKSNKKWVGVGIALFIGMLGGLIVLWLLKTPKGKGSKESK